MLIAAAIWGFAFVAQKEAAHVPSFTLVFARSLLGTVFLFFLIMILDRVKKNGRRLVSRKGLDFTKTELVGGVACGIVLSLASVLQQSGINDGTDAGKAASVLHWKAEKSLEDMCFDSWNWQSHNINGYK